MDFASNPVKMVTRDPVSAESLDPPSNSVRTEFLQKLLQVW
jgi:hypothetical protein